jgi:predicted DNA-binding transcriptional regulator AlpA
MRTAEKRLYNSADVMGRYGFSRYTLGRLVKSGHFPAPVPAYPGARMWLIDDLNDWEEKLKGRR